MWAIIPAGGKGTRLRPITDFIPKELIMLGDKPIIGHILDNLKHLGILNVCVVVGHKKTTILDYLKDGKEFGLDIEYVYQVEQKGLGDAILSTKEKINANSIFIYLGDIFLYPLDSIKQMISVFQTKKSFGVVLLNKVFEPEHFGVVKIDEKTSEILDFYEKPTDPKIKEEFRINDYWLSISGIYILSTKIYDYLEKTPFGKNNELQLTDALKLALEDGNKFIGVIHKGVKFDIGTMDAYLKAQKWFFQRQKY